MFCCSTKWILFIVPFFVLIVPLQAWMPLTTCSFAVTRFSRSLVGRTCSTLRLSILTTRIMKPLVKSQVGPLRRSGRLRKLHGDSETPQEEGSSASTNKAPKPQTKRRKKQASSNAVVDEEAELPLDCLPRLREGTLMAELTPLRFVMGIDEAGRGPLAGPVVAAAAIVPTNIAGVVDSKKVTKEETRERLYQEIVSSPNVRWAAAVVDAPRIDEINILQATMQAMKMAANAVMAQEPVDRCEVASVAHTGCYVVCGQRSLTDEIDVASGDRKALDSESVYALVDGNRVPKEMPCTSEFIIKGDSKEYSIAAASIIAKVTRDRLMNAYDELYPEFGLQQHKGYPTANHRAAVHEHGASPIHRRTFAPLKHMEFDEEGKIIGEKKVVKKKK